MSLSHHVVPQDPLAELSRFRGEFYSCLTKRADALFELADAVLCADGPVRSLVELSLVGEHRRGHGGLYDALSAGRVEVGRLWWALAAVPLPRAADGRLVLAADLTCWLRPSAHTSPQRILCHTYGRGKDQHIPVPGWPYSEICALETGRSSWTAPLDALRLAPGDDAATATARQMRELVERLITAGQWKDADLDILIVVDAGYDVPRLAFLLKDLPVQVLGRMRSDRVLRRAAPPREPGVRGRPPRHGGEFVFGDPNTWNTPPRTHGDRNSPLRHRHRTGLGPAPPETDAPLGLDSPTGRPASDRGHRDPPAGRPLAQRCDTETGLAVVVGHRCHRSRRRPALADISATLRHRAHLPALQTDTRLDLPEDPHPRSRRPLDLADPCGFHPAPNRSSLGGRPPQAVGETDPARQTHPSTRPPRLPAPPPQDRLPGQSTEILPARPRTATRPQEQPTHHTL